MTGVVGVSALAQFFYYGSANISALRLKIGAGARVYLRSFPTIGLATCLILLFFVQQLALVIGIACLGQVWSIICLLEEKVTDLVKKSKGNKSEQANHTISYE